MAKNGFVIGFADDTSSPPTLYWNGVEQVATVDDAKFIATIAAARVESGNLQVSYPENHVEAYAVSLAITHTPALGLAGI